MSTAPCLAHNEGERFRVAGLLEQLDGLVVLRTRARKAMVAEARRYADQALTHLNGFPDSAAKHALGEIARFVVSRAA